MRDGARPAERQRILVTGASGFVGIALCRRLSESSFEVRAALRDNTRAGMFPDGIETCAIGEVGAHTPWSEAMPGVAAIIHLVSGIATSEQGQNASLLERYNEVNIAGTRSLIMAAAEHGVRRIVFLSTIKVNGEQTMEGAPFTETDQPRPEQAYAHSKWEAEKLLHEQCQELGLMLTILRPPLVYGPGVKGNFLALMKALQHGIPLPLASIDNRRSMIYIGNLVDSVMACLESTLAAGKTYLVSDGEDLSTPDLIRKLAQALGISPRLFPFPVRLLALGAATLGRREDWRRLAGSLQVDSSKVQQELGWRPPFSVAQGLQETARWFLQASSSK